MKALEQLENIEKQIKVLKTLIKDSYNQVEEITYKIGDMFKHVKSDSIGLIVQTDSNTVQLIDINVSNRYYSNRTIKVANVNKITEKELTNILRNENDYWEYLPNLKITTKTI